MLRFTDGVNIDTSGPYRVLKLKDGYYVTGHGMLSPEPNRETAYKYLAELQAKETK